MQAQPLLYIVDNEADYRFLVKEIFGRFLPQYTVRFFASGTALQQHIQAEAVPTETNQRAFAPALPGLILLDLHMTNISGLQTLTYLKQQNQWKLIPVVIMSSSASTEETCACYGAGASSFLTKPTDLKHLRERLESTCQYWFEFNRMPQS